MNNQKSTHRKRPRSLAGATLAVLLLSAGTVVAAQSANAAQPAHICGSANLFIGVRGTSAAAGSTPSESGNAWQVGGMGDQISVLAAHYKNTYPYNSTDFPTYVESLNYPATVDQVASSAIGRSKLINELNWVATHCTKLMPNIILAGHSQGAMVISGVLAEPTMLNAKAKAAIKAVAVFGDPMHRNTMPYKVYNNSGNGLLYASTTQVATISTWRYYGWEPGSTATSPAYHYLIRDYCFSGDAACQSGTGSTAWDIHNAYSSMMYQVTPWIDGLLTNTN